MALRTFQRRVLAWRLQHGPDKEVFFAQEHLPGRVMQLDWTNANELGVTIAGRLLEHLLCHSVLPYSNWEWASRCQSESLLSLRHGLQESLHQLGAAPERLQIDNSSAATHRVGSGGREFNPDFLSLVQHYGMKPQTIGIDCPDQNGDVESQNGHLKRRLTEMGQLMSLSYRIALASPLRRGRLGGGAGRLIANEQALSHQGVDMRMKVKVFPKGVRREDDPRNTRGQSRAVRRGHSLRLPLQSPAPLAFISAD